MLFEVHNIQKKTSFTGYSWTYSGLASGADFSRIPASLTIPEKEGLHRPRADKDYLIRGTLNELAPYRYQIKIDRNAPWTPLRYSWSLAEWRNSAKESLKAYIEHHYKSRSAAKFLAGMTTGHLDDKTLGTDFSRFGLQHILAISGFHFALIALFLQSFGSLFFSLRASTYLLILAMTSYFIFLGPSPSIIRAWIACLYPLAGLLIHRRVDSLNALALGVIAVLMFDPYAILNLGFQFSFAATFAILVYFKPIDEWLCNAFQKRPLSVAVEMSRLNQHAYLILSYLRQVLSLTLAVNLAVIPLSMIHFEQVPFLSLLYNLFFPLMVSLSMVLFLIGTLPFFSWFLHEYNNLYTRFVLDFTSQLPQEMDFYIKGDFWTSKVALSYFTALFLIGIIIHTTRMYENKSYEVAA